MQITQKLTLDTLEIQFLSYFFCNFLGHFKPILIQGVQGVWFLVILRAFDIKMSRVASRIYALLSVIRQQMSPFFSFSFWGGVRQKGTMSPFLPFSWMRASLISSL